MTDYRVVWIEGHRRTGQWLVDCPGLESTKQAHD
jgi:hypothetical protein